jgi:hypothetical protein
VIQVSSLVPLPSVGFRRTANEKPTRPARAVISGTLRSGHSAGVGGVGEMVGLGKDKAGQASG